MISNRPPADLQQDEVDSEDEYEERQWEAQHGQPNGAADQDDEAEDRELDKDLEWTARKPQEGQKYPYLRVPVLVPQVALGLVSLFHRAWAPDLAAHDVRAEEWLQFVDHLNVCKTGSPPLQVLNMAGTVVGFVPVHYAGIAGLATNVVSVGGMVAVSRIRISRYLKRANAEYFIPRGLVALIAKEKTLHEITHQSPDAPKLSEPNDPDPANWPDVIERRMQTLQGHVAALQYESLPAPQKEQSTVDRMAAKMNALKERRGQKKDANGNVISKHQAKLDKERAKRQEEEDEIRADAEKEMRKKPEKREKIERKMNKELAELQEDADSDDQDFLEKSGKGGKKTDRKVNRLMYIAVQDLSDYQRTHPDA